MSRSYEHYRDGEQIDWYERGEEDRIVYDGLMAEPTNESRFETPRDFVPDIPPVEKSDEYNAFDTYTPDDWEMWWGNHSRFKH